MNACVCTWGAALCAIRASAYLQGRARGRAVPAEEEGAALCAAVYCCGQAQCAFISACM